ncbi:MAG: hypothetical protein Hyperionvirus14_43 [Hyperionvirus sp.]|uniref:Uncharacterized protein n=1 Tax=Hyperionvirus sp. TaxID=2487770 RepID=A0A3G5ABJ8_9VIRU|nr:MAG: hypothetical protein Hyperionvirus14_43 [Hyperionvirus sp.]
MLRMVRASDIRERWHRQGTASEHIIAIVWEGGFAKVIRRERFFWKSFVCI